MTQKKSARQGIVTPEMQIVAETEQIGVDELLAEVAAGRITIPANKKRTTLKVSAVGKKVSVKVNANVGVSPTADNTAYELKKLYAALDAGADAVMDLSVGPRSAEMRRQFLDHCNALTGSVPLYRLISDFKGDLSAITEADFIKAVERDAEDGIDFVTVHCGISLKDLEHSDKRLMGIVSRGGSFVAKWMRHHKKENPFLTNYHRLVEIGKEYDLTLSLGDSLRPGALADAGDPAQMNELARMGEQVLQAWESDVQVIVEGPGHVPLHMIESQVKTMDELCHGAPLYLLGPLVTDRAPGHDHITGAIGGALAAMHGCSFLCYVTPSEHLRLPSTEDVREGVIASRIAGHAADIARGCKRSFELNREFSAARRRFDWDAQFAMAIDKVKPVKMRALDEQCRVDECTMCGDFCAMKETR